MNRLLASPGPSSTTTSHFSMLVSFSRVGSVALPLKTGINAKRQFSNLNWVPGWQGNSYLIVNAACEFILWWLSMYTMRSIGVSSKEFIADQSKGCVCRLGRVQRS